ncbi:TniQ family protein [Tunturiibacter lichenicola]|uniref:TniQ family protein n=1 Tax=Tunturiibacter lichenicola TaxID=2051959 RepID=UPI003D9B0C6A
MTNASNLLPWHPRRLDDEILSSWMLSIASGNGISVRSLCAWLGTDDWVREIDSMEPYNPLVNHIAEAAGVEKDIFIKSLPSGLYGLFGSRPRRRWFFFHRGPGVFIRPVFQSAR